MFEKMDTGEFVVMGMSIAVGITIFILAQFRSIRSRIWESEQRIIAKVDESHDDLKERSNKQKTSLALIRQKLGMQVEDV